MAGWFDLTRFAVVLIDWLIDCMVGWMADWFIKFDLMCVEFRFCLIGLIDLIDLLGSIFKGFVDPRWVKMFMWYVDGLNLSDLIVLLHSMDAIDIVSGLI